MQVERVSESITKWLKDYAQNAGMKGYVVGISGGIDSAVTSTLCAATGLDTLCVEMPIHQHLDHVTRAQEHIKSLKARFNNVSDVRSDLTPVFDTFIKTMPDADPSPLKELTEGNTRARLRMTTLYYHGGMNSLLVAGTGNKVEDFGVGFYTKYGDGGVDVSPIADLLKSEVYKLGKYLSVQQSILKAAPSDGLYGAEKTDEEQIGATYDELEWAMEEIEKGKTAESFVGREKEVMHIYLSYNSRNQHKMNPIPLWEFPGNLR
ncbi:NAD(+) synthase [Nonlabens marinus]|uniref:NH(3)-dependent NAD(+) synthetase n=1 Tax=Nonlabens marinus S1-08 TaxID=1454201 RepID=W8VP94_9FLAO|nr:NAD(+) synthase [Nonlabens marinus]BAO54340.1 NAD synthetase [Nonlabens marinus S1-08]